MARSTLNARLGEDGFELWELSSAADRRLLFDHTMKLTNQ